MLRTTDVGFIFDGIVRDRVLVLRGGVGFVIVNVFGMMIGGCGVGWLLFLFR